MKKIYCHDFGPKGQDGKFSAIFDGIPAQMFYYSSRALVLAKKGDIVVLPADEISQAAANITPLLNQYGVGPNPKDIVFIGFDDNGRIVDPDNSITRLTNKKKTAVNTTVDVFTGMAFLPHYLAAETKSTIGSPLREQVIVFDGKDYFQKCNFPSSVPGVVLTNAKLARQYFASLNGDLMIAKTTHSSAGQSAHLLHPDGLGKKKVLNVLGQGKKFVVQKYFSHQESPSVNVEIAPNRKIISIFLSTQIMEKSDSGVEGHEGNIYPTNYPQNIKDYLLSNSTYIAKKYAQQGYHGSFGVDWILSNQKLNKWYAYVVEVNARSTAPKYAYYLMLQLGAKSFCMRNFHFASGLSIDDLHKCLEPIFWDPSKKYGVMFFNYNPNGKMVLVALGKCREQTLELLQTASGLI